MLQWKTNWLGKEILNPRLCRYLNKRACQDIRPVHWFFRTVARADGALFQLPDDARSNRYIRPYLVSDDSTLYYSLMTPLQLSGCPRTPLLQVDPENVRAPFHGVGQDSLIEPQRKILREVEM